MEYNEVLQFVKQTISESTGEEIENIHENSTLFDELGLTSIDIIDVLYALEMEYDIKIKINEMEKYTKAKLNGKPYSIDGVITKEALEILKNYMSDVPPERLKYGITEKDVLMMITVGMLAKSVLYKIQENEGE